MDMKRRTVGRKGEDWQARSREAAAAAQVAEPTVSLNQLARELGVSPTSVSRRMRRGQSQDEIRRVITIKRQAGLLHQSAPVNTLTSQIRAMVEVEVRRVGGVAKG